MPELLSQCDTGSRVKILSSYCVHVVACAVCRAVRTPGHPSQCLASPAMALPQHNSRLRTLVILDILTTA